MDSEETIALRERLSRFSQAARTINQSLDFDAVLQGVLDSARLLTRARYGVIALTDHAGRPVNFLASGMSTDESRALWKVSEGEQWFAYLATIREPLRLSDLQHHFRSLGLPEFRVPFPVSKELPFLAAPISYAGIRVGNIFVAELPSGQEFSQEDEEILVMFGSQAALVITNARRYRDEQRARRDLETLIHTSPFGVLVFEARTGSVISMNSEAKRIVVGLREQGQKVEELLGMLTVQLGDGREFSFDEFSIAEALSKEEKTRAEEVILKAPNGTAATALTNATPIYADDGELESVLVTLQDMEPLQALERLQVNFLGMVSHELRTPLAAIKGSASTVLSSAGTLGSAEMKQYFRVIDSQADSMRDLIGNLLDQARIESGTFSIAPQPVKALILLEQARNAFLNSHSSHTLEIDLEPNLPLVKADQYRVVQVLNNLLVNAANNSPEETKIRLSAKAKEPEVAFCVTDQGVGMSREHLSHVFHKYSRIEREPGQKNPTATGIGLAICKGIVESHGGRIWAESDGIGKGARFTFTLPADVESGAEDPIDLSGTAQAESSSLLRSRILVVDDDAQMLGYVREILSNAGYVPVATADPKEAPRLLRANMPDLILLELILPDVDGIELMTNLLEIAALPVMFISGSGRDETIARALEMGAIDYVVKPFSPRELLARIKAALRKSRASSWEARR